MLAASMDLLLRADADDEAVIPDGSLIEAVSGQRYTSTPWLLWEPLAVVAVPEERRELGIEKNMGKGGPFGRAMVGTRDLIDGTLRLVLPDRLMGRFGAGKLVSRRPPTPAKGPRTRPIKPGAVQEPAAGPSPVAVAKVREVVSSAAPRLKLSPSETAERLGADEVARRIGMSRGLARACLNQLSERGY